MSTTERYGLRWKDQDDLQIEMACIQKDGRWKIGEKEYGEGMFHHFRAMQRLLWPDEDDHRWSDLMLSTILTNRITVVAGAKDSGKTHTMSKFALTDYWCFPNETLTMMSSTDIRGLELRVWGDVKDLLDRARERYPYLAGNVVDAKHGIFTDSLDDTGDVRDMRKGILCIPCIGSSGEFVGISKFVGVKQKRRRLLGDECFPAGAMVDTPIGPVAIESLEIGDFVYNAIGTGVVCGIRCSTSESLLTISMRDGRKITCTRDHEFITQKGWRKACELDQSHYILSTYETEKMSVVPESISALWKAEVLRYVQRKTKDMRGVLEPVQGSLSEFGKTLLQYVVQEQVAIQARGVEGEILHTGKSGEVKGCENTVASRSQRAFKGDSSEDAGFDARTRCHSEKAHEREPEGIGTSTEVQGRERNWSHPTGVKASKNGPWWSLELWNQDGSLEWERIPSGLQSGRGITGDKVGNRSRWEFSPYGGPKTEGQKEGRFLKGSWVDSVEIYKQTIDESSITSDGSGGYRVYNLQVTGHPSYSVNGLCVHNCQFMQQSYLDSMANLDKGNFLGCFVGNPIGNGDPLDRLSEPVGGWDSLGEVTKTTTWANKFGGTTINFVGIDSPNFDADKPKSYPYLIDQGDVDRIGQRYGKDSALFWSQIMGVRKAGINAHRVLTMEMCNKYGAFDACVWSGSETVKVFGVDAGYGGDLCVGICAEFGTEVTGITAIKFHEPVVIPVRLSAAEIVEDQIANFVKGECIREGIPDEHIFIEAGMRATLAVSFSRILSPKINAINFGGAATDRPVSNDLFILDERTMQRRHKKCNEHYSKYVTQLWFSVRAAVESSQIRDFPKKVAQEFAMREWYMVHGDRYELETKIECKERMGESPNYADAAAVAMEGALRLGFLIESLRVEDPKSQEHNQWLDKAIKEERTKRSKYQLNYAN